MSVTSVEKDPESLTMTVTADLDATVERAWQLWADPRQFEQWYEEAGGDGPWCTTVSFVNPHDIAWWWRWTSRSKHEATVPTGSALKFIWTSFRLD